MKLTKENCLGVLGLPAEVRSVAGKARLRPGCRGITAEPVSLRAEVATQQWSLNAGDSR